MKKNNGSFIDLSEFDNITQVYDAKYSIIYHAQKKYSPFQKYLFKKFKLKKINSTNQKKILDTFYRLNFLKDQYLQCYNRISFTFPSDKEKENPQSEFFLTLSTKFISQTTLEELLNSPDFSQKWTIQDMMRCLFGVAHGMYYLHKRLICHGNLCPSNIVVDVAKQCYVCDFGLYPIKKLFIDQEDMANKIYRDPSLGYPPLLLNDVYSYGVLICQLCLPFLDPNNNANFHDFITNFDQSKLSNFPPFISQLIIDCLNPKVELRPFFKSILEKFETGSLIIDSYIIKDVYSVFVKTNYVETLANLNDPFALNKLGGMYEKGKFFTKNAKKALIYYEKAALLNNSEAQSNYGVLLQERSGKKNKKKGAEYLKLSALKGNIHGMANYGIALQNGDGVKVNIKKALEYLKKSADLGYAYAQVNYGYSLIENNPIPENINEGLSYIKMAIDQDYPEAYYSYGVLLQLGNYIRQNSELAMDNFKIAADLGHGYAMLEYADGCLSGVGVQKNSEIALKYYKMAFKNGISEAKEKMDMMIQQETEEEEISSKELSNNDQTETQNSEIPIFPTLEIDENINLKINENTQSENNENYQSENNENAPAKNNDFELSENIDNNLLKSNVKKPFQIALNDTIDEKSPIIGFAENEKPNSQLYSTNQQDENIIIISSSYSDFSSSDSTDDIIIIDSKPNSQTSGSSMPSSQSHNQSTPLQTIHSDHQPTTIQSNQLHNSQTLSNPTLPNDQPLKITSNQFQKSISMQSVAPDNQSISMQSNQLHNSQTSSYPTLPNDQPLKISSNQSQNSQTLLQSISPDNQSISMQSNQSENQSTPSPNTKLNNLLSLLENDDNYSDKEDEVVMQEMKSTRKEPKKVELSEYFYMKNLGYQSKENYLNRIQHIIDNLPVKDNQNRRLTFQDYYNIIPKGKYINDDLIEIYNKFMGTSISRRTFGLFKGVRQNFIKKIKKNYNFVIYEKL